jgi:hypothetical protein
MNLNGIYVGKVEAVNDPEKLGRVKVRVPHVYGILGSVVGQVPLDDLPWAIPLGLPAGQSQQSGGMDWLPEPGDQVAVQFLDGEPEKPVWSWLMQTTQAAAAFALHSYGTSGPSQGLPNRSALTRYGHAIEWNAGSIVLTTSRGYRLFALDASTSGNDGYLQLVTQSGQLFELNDQTQGGLLNILEDFQMQIGQELTLEVGNLRLTSADTLDATILGITTLDFNGQINLTGSSGFDGEFVNDFTLSALNTSLTSQAQSTFVAPITRIGTSAASANEPFVKGTQFSLWVTSLLVWLATHTHTSGASGSPTSPPLVPPVGAVQPQVPQLISTAIFGE